MRKLKYALIVILATPLLLNARGPEEGKEEKKKDQNLPVLAAGCTAAEKFVFIEFNNAKTRVEAGGLWWQDRANSRADYEVPVGSGSFALFAGGLWLAGTDVNGQLKAAASLFGRGVDFWSGPLDTARNDLDPQDCQKYDRFYEISRQEVADFVAYQAAVAEGTASEEFPDYLVPVSIKEWPGNGDASRGQDFNLAPYRDVGGDAGYDSDDGDYPFYDLVGDIDCRAERKDRSESSTRPLFGDKTYWWVFNDRGNLHTETNAPSIGMEIHGQAFAFATNDAVNDMTFYNFELINRSTFTLTDTYFASYVDPDLGNPFDDYVGCDVNRGLGFCYNGDEVDEDFRGVTGYGTTPAAIGIDFFEGPYQDADGINNLVGIGPNQALNGLGYRDTTDLFPDSIQDNERFGMRRFVYYNGGTGNNGDPDLAVHYYNYMRGIWKNGRRMLFGGNGFNDGVQNLPTDFMFPGESDPMHWGTSGIVPSPNFDWSEDVPGVGARPNNIGDRRFLQSAGPFTLEPGNVNDITVGVVFAQAESGGRLASVEKLFQADDKAQALFDNCFQVLNGPDAPDVEIQELDQELVFYISNPLTSNNGEERGDPYIEDDPDIVTPLFLRDQGTFYDNNYRFQGYQVYQLAGPGISVNDIGDLDKARLVFQCDVKDGVADLINFTFDESLNANIPVKRVTAANQGIQRSFSVTEDLYATGGSKLVNYKTYYYLAIAYGHNEFKPYAQDLAPDQSNPFAPASDGQTAPYISSRRSATGGAIRPFIGVPHDPLFEKGGTVVNSSYGDQIQITRLQGFGNGGRALLPSQESIDRILQLKTWEDPNALIGEIDYARGQGPFEIKVIDPLNTIDGTFYLQILDELIAGDSAVVTDTAEWKIWLDGGTEDDTVYSEKVIEIESEQLLLNPNWGLSISIANGVRPGQNIPESNNGFISSSITFEDENNQWLVGIPDVDTETPDNWIVSGTFSQGQILDCIDPTDPACRAVYNDNMNPDGVGFPDPEDDYESIAEKTIAPYHLTRYIYTLGNQLGANAPANSKADVDMSTLDKLNSFILVITSDQSNWTRCPVIETSEADPDLKNSYKRKLSVDKNGNSVDTSGGNFANIDSVDSQVKSNDPNSPAYISSVGMGWFPGYVLNKETGERMNMAFGEDSRYPINNGNDMQWNPNSTLIQGAGTANFIWGGKHFIYIFRKTLESEKDEFTFTDRRVGTFEFFMPEYDAGQSLINHLKFKNSLITNPTPKQYAWGSCSWVAAPLLNPLPNNGFLSTDVRIDVNVSAPFGVQESNIDANLDNDGKPVYKFSTEGLGVVKNAKATLKDALEQLNVVPNPYYAISEYEASQLDNTVKFTNLPENCTITIYNTNGTLIRRYNKSDPLNYLDWNLKNQVGIPISSGVYLIHIEVPGVGEKILKWFGVVRPVDLNNF